MTSCQYRDCPPESTKNLITIRNRAIDKNAVIEMSKNKLKTVSIKILKNLISKKNLVFKKIVKFPNSKTPTNYVAYKQSKANVALE